jgi:SAM-dependent methyltransferase
MISDAELPELSFFRKAEARSRFEISTLYEGLVVAATNDRSPVHRWFRFKESFSADLLRVVLDDLEPRRKKIRLLDPFCGVGTSLIASQELHAADYTITATGIERNPFIAFVARTKVNWPRMDKQVLRELPPAILARQTSTSPSLPQNSSFLTSRCITSHVTRRLLQVAQAIREHGTTPSHEALLLGLASAIEPLSRTRKDGRALRIVTKPRTTISSVLAARWNSIVEDVGLMQRSLGSVPVPEVLFGDGRRPALLGIPANSQDLVFTSPPYPNNIDYTEVYKLELWLLGYVKSASEFLQLRRQTFRSHPTSGLEDPCKDFIAASRRGRLGSLLSPIVTRIADLEEPWRRRVLLGYFSDLWTTLEGCHRVLRDGGHAVFVVGNSLHGAAANPYLIPTDLLLGAIAERIGFRVERTIAARSLKRRLSGNHFLRESLVVLRKPRG